ncbi:MAG: hypothetical protein Q8O64_10970 [Sideroxyarcus sp.]|nr:hypothetical protein [Sideroxyarcus sp.]
MDRIPESVWREHSRQYRDYYGGSVLQADSGPHFVDFDASAAGKIA